VTRPALLAVLLLCAGCGMTVEAAEPRCGAVERLALVAQSVPTATYVPCLQDLPVGWRTTRFEAERGSTRLSLLSDRSGGRPVEVVLSPACDVSGASPARPRADGVRSYLELDTVAPLYAGTAYDVFPGGCVQYAFALPRGPHIPLMEDLDASIGLVPRRELRLDVRERTGAELDP
jgi:hypothetical protein